jgi:inosine-uridine nucleoside N-ribohydrolase
MVMVQNSMARPIEWIVNIRRKVSLPLAAMLLCSAAVLSAKTPVLLSTDVGNEIDDQWAIVYLLASPEFDVQGIVSAHAPSLPAPSAHATYKILVDEVENRMGMMTHPPLLEGSSLPLEDNKTPQPSAGLDFILQASEGYSKENRLNVLTIGAATDVASAILKDPAIVDRINVVAMGFKDLSSDGGKEYNVQNDPKAWQIILKSGVPVTIGSGDVCRANLSLSFQQAAALLSGHGPVAAWLWDEYQTWYYVHIKPLRVNDFSKPWIIWDIITLAYVEGITTQKEIARPVLGDDLSLKDANKKEAGKINWIETVDSARLWKEFIERLDAYDRTHAIKPQEAR